VRLLIPLFVFASIAAQRSMAEVSELRISRGYGILYLPLFVIENQKPPALTSELRKSKYRRTKCCECSRIPTLGFPRPPTG